MVGDGPLQHPDLPSAAHAGNPAPGPLHGAAPSVLGCWEVVGTAGELMGPFKKKKQAKGWLFLLFLLVFSGSSSNHRGCLLG